MQALTGDFARARTSLAEWNVDGVEKGDVYEFLAYRQAKAGQVDEALRWAESLDHRLHRSRALVGVAVAIEERRGSKPKEGQPLR